MKKVKSFLTVFAFVFAIGAALVTTTANSESFQVAWGDNPDVADPCNEGTILDEVDCGTIDQSHGTCTVSFGATNDVAKETSSCANFLYRQQ